MGFGRLAHHWVELAQHRVGRGGGLLQPPAKHQQPRHARTGLTVPHVRLDAAQARGDAPLVMDGAEHGRCERSRLDRVAQHRAGAVRLEARELGRVDSRLGVRR